MTENFSSLRRVESTEGVERYVQDPTLVREKPVEFKVFKCDSCHIKVSTSNGKCPCCGKELDK